MLVFFLSGYFILKVIDKWNTSPIIISINAVSTPISEIPFPAVTICNMNQARRSIVQQLIPGSYEDEMLQSLCGSSVNYTGRTNRTDWTKFRYFLKTVSQPCAGMLITCRYAHVYQKCMELFTTVLTDEGLCCIFNRADPKYLLLHFK